MRPMGAKPWSFRKKMANKRGTGSPSVFIGKGKGSSQIDRNCPR
jgi:hypothetical protein